MSTSPAVLNKIEALPDHVKEQLFHYVEFLYAIYGPGDDRAEPGSASNSDEYELTEAGKKFLEDRLQKALAHPEKRKHWREVAARIQEKYKGPHQK